MDSDDWTGVGVGAFVLGLVGFLGWAIVRDVKASRKEKEKHAVSDSIATRQSLDSIANSQYASGSPTYVLDSLDLAKMTYSAKIVNAKKIAETKKVIAPAYYGKAEVNPLQKFPNAKLVGVDHYNIEYSLGEGFGKSDEKSLYFAKGLLFELDSNKLVNLIAKDYSFYVGQRYNISYYTFKNRVNVYAGDVLRGFLDKKVTTTDEEKPADMYDGVLIYSELNRKNK